MTPADELVLAVDGGGFKTDLALLDRSGALRAHVRGGRSQFHYLGVDGCVAVLESLLERAFAAAGLSSEGRPLAATAQLLLSGIDIPEELQALSAGLSDLRWTDRLVVGNDSEALLRAGTDRGWGVAVVCGTGINCLGLAPDGREARFLSFGDISGDWGGGGDVGLAALAAAVRAADGRDRPTMLQKAVPAHFGLDDPLAVARAVHLGEIDRARLGELTAIVLRAGDEDPAAASILDRLAEEIVAFVRAAMRRTGLTGSDPDVVLGGRVLRSAPPALISVIEAGIRECSDRASVVISPSEPIVGAALLGLDAVGAGRSALQRARAELDLAVTRVLEPVPDDRDRSMTPARGGA